MDAFWISYDGIYCNFMVFLAVVSGQFLSFKFPKSLCFFVFSGPGAFQKRSGTCLNSPGVFFCIDFVCENG